METDPDRDVPDEWKNLPSLAMPDGAHNLEQGLPALTAIIDLQRSFRRYLFPVAFSGRPQPVRVRDLVLPTDRGR